MIHHTSYGQGQRHFLGFHGWGSDHKRSFSNICAHMPNHVTFTGLDLPGFGRSTKPESSASFEEINNVIVRQESLWPKDRTYTFIGSCSGSFHALEVAQQRRAHVNSIVLLEPFAFMPWFFSIFLKPVFGRVLYNAVFDNPMGQAITKASLKRQQVHTDFDMVQAFGRQDLKVSYQYLEHYGAIQGPERWANVDVPVRIIYGARTWRAIHDALPLWRRNWPTLDDVCITQAGHMFSQEHPERTALAIFPKVLATGSSTFI